MAYEGVKVVPLGRLALPRLTASEAGQSAKFPINHSGI